MSNKKRVIGDVDRITSGIVVVVIQDPKGKKGETREVYIPKDKIKRKDIKEGDKVSVLIDE